jgi:hypothetical protein
MKRAIFLFFIYLSASSILVSGNGIVLSIHTCLFNSEKNISLFKENSCCSSKEKSCDSCNHDEKPSVTTKCCTSEVSYHKINTTFLPQKSAGFPEITFFQNTFSDVIVHSETGINYYFFIPPLLPERLPILHHQLLI